jgi:endonuclease/exonuclease/phosphatase family metal-dependent hydrolase
VSARLWRGIAIAIAAALGAGCRPAPLVLVPTNPLVRSCEGDPQLVTWRRAADPSAQLVKWCESVGPPVVVAAPPLHTDVRRLLVVSWNVHVGGGRVKALVDQILDRTPRPPVGEVGVVLILQETFRAGPAVPERIPDPAVVPAAIRPDRPRADVGELARSMDMSVAYVPSMRNGSSSGINEREDRGSAILSTETLSGITAIELPFGKQRRVAVLATVTPAGSAGAPVHIIAGHFDSLVGTRRQAAALAGYIDELKELGEPVVLGIDTNAVRGRADGAVHALEKALSIEPCGNGRTGTWLARVDFIFSNLAGFRKACETFEDRYGSDHVPQLLTLDLPQRD